MDRIRYPGGWLMAFLLVAGVGRGVAVEEVAITFQVVPMSLPEPRVVYVTGNHPRLGDWRPDGLLLEEQAGGAWSRTVLLPVGTELEFKVTRGAWAREALDAEGRVPGNRHWIVTGPATVRQQVTTWKDEVEQPTGGITGTLVYHRDFKAEGLLPRDVLVWLPPSYDADPERRYPVLYMHDGQQVFDPATSTHGIDWQVDERVTELAAAGRMKEIIVVATTSTAERGEEYGYAGENLVWVKDPDAEHNEAAWSRRVHVPLLMFFGTAGPESNASN